MIGALATAFALALAPYAQDQSTFEPVQVGSWMVMRASPESCQMVAAYGDHVMLSIVEDAEGNGFLFFSDDRWLLKEGDAKPGTVSWDNWKTAKPIEFKATLFSNDRWVLMGETDASFTENLAEAQRFWLRVPGVEFDDDFDVADTPKVLAAVQECNAKD